MLTGTKMHVRAISSWLTHKAITTGHVPSPDCISKSFGVSRATGYRWYAWAKTKIPTITSDSEVTMHQSTAVEHANRPSAVESSDFDHTAEACLCGAQPLITHSGGQFYMSCPPCWARGHRFDSQQQALTQWNAMIQAARKMQ